VGVDHRDDRGEEHADRSSCGHGNVDQFGIATTLDLEGQSTDGHAITPRVSVPRIP
jgi:hypothetical protein